MILSEMLLTKYGWKYALIITLCTASDSAQMLPTITHILTTHDLLVAFLFVYCNDHNKIWPMS